MAKKKTTTVSPDVTSPITPPQFLRLAEPLLPAIKTAADNDADRTRQLKAIYELGKLLVDHVPKNSSYGENPMPRLAEALGYSGGWLSKVRRFALIYDKSEFNALLKTGLNFGHVGLLLGLSDSQRARYQADTDKHGWTVGALQIALRNRPDIVPRGGQPMKVPKDPATALRKLVAEGQSWQQRCEKTAELIANKKISGKLREQARETAAELQATIKAVQGVAKTLAGLK